MLIDILMESLLSMDDDTLGCVLESCSDEELDLIDGAMEALSDQDKEDFRFVNKIQRDATSKGWGNVPKEDRDKFVNVMTKTKNLDLLKKAMQIGKREASHDDEVKDAMRALGTGAIGAGFGALAAKNAIKDQMPDIDALGEKSWMAKAYGKTTQRDINSKIADLKDFIVSSNGKVGSHEITRAKRDLNKLSAIGEKFAATTGKDIDAIDTTVRSYGDIANTAGAKLGELQGSVIGAGIGVGVGAGISALKQYKKYNKDRNAVMSQGDVDHPNNRWKKNRKDAELRAKFGKMRKDVLAKASV